MILELSYQFITKRNALKTRAYKIQNVQYLDSKCEDVYLPTKNITVYKSILNLKGKIIFKV